MNSEIKFLKMDDRLAKALQNTKVEKKQAFREVPPDEFIKQRDQLQLDLLAYLDKHADGRYKEMDTVLYMSDDNKCGFGINPDGALISVFSLERERGSQLVQEAVSKGAKHLGCLGDKLRQLYGEAGFDVIRESPWNEEYAPENWNYERFGQPSYYEMKIKDKKE